MGRHVPFLDLMSSPEVVGLADRLFADASMPDFISKFLALTMVCAVAEPDENIGGDESTEYAGSGVCVFYAPELEDSEPTGRWEPWTCRLNLGESMSFVFEKVGDYTQTLSEDDSWRVPQDGSRPGDEHLGWQPRTMELLRSSLWRPLNDAEALGR